MTIEVATRAGKFTDSCSAVHMTKIFVREQCPFAAYSTYLLPKQSSQPLQQIRLFLLLLHVHCIAHRWLSLARKVVGAQLSPQWTHGQLEVPSLSPRPSFRFFRGSGSETKSGPGDCDQITFCIPVRMVLIVEEKSRGDGVDTPNYQPRPQSLSLEGRTLRTHSNSVTRTQEVVGTICVSSSAGKYLYLRSYGKQTRSTIRNIRPVLIKSTVPLLNSSFASGFQRHVDLRTFFYTGSKYKSHIRPARTKRV